MDFDWIRSKIKLYTNNNEIIDMFPDTIETLDGEAYILFKLKMFLNYCNRCIPSSYWPGKYPEWYDPDMHISIPEFTPNGWSYRKTYIWLYVFFLELDFEIYSFFSKKSYEVESYEKKSENLIELINKIDNDLENMDDLTILEATKSSTDFNLLFEKSSWNPFENSTTNVVVRTPLDDFIDSPDEYSLFDKSNFLEFGGYEDEIFFKNIFILTPFVDERAMEYFYFKVDYYVKNYKDNTISNKYWVITYDEQNKRFIQQYSSLYGLTWEYYFLPKDNEYFINKFVLFYLFIFNFGIDRYIKFWLKNNKINDEYQIKMLEYDFDENNFILNSGVWVFDENYFTKEIAFKKANWGISYERLDFYITADEKLKSIIDEVSKIINITVEKLFDDDYKSIKITKKSWIPDLLEWDMIFDGDDYNYVDLERKYAHSSIKWEVHKWDTKVYKVKEKIKFQKNWKN